MAEIQDRRRGKRIFTLRNAGRFAVAVLLVFLAISVASEFREDKPGEYGRLYERRTRNVEIQPRKPYTVVQESNISDQSGADPMLLESARRQQYLGVTDADLARMRELAQPKTDTQAPLIIPGGQQGLLQQNSNREKAKYEITGGPEGVYVKKE